MHQLLSRDDKILFLKLFAQDNKCYLELEGEVGICRECVGIVHGSQYPEYDSSNDKLSPPEGVDAYHKHDCVAVLGRGDPAINGLYEWCLKLKQNGAKLKVSDRNFQNDSPDGRIIEALVNGLTIAEFVTE